MDSSCKNICYIDEIITRKMLEGFFSSHTPDSFFKESTRNPMQAIYKTFLTGKVTGKSVNGFCIAPIIVPILAMNDFVQEITLLQSNDAGVKELENWKNKTPNAFDWSRVTEFLKELKENSESDEESLRGKTKILKYNLSEDNPADALSLPRADIATSIWFLEYISKNHDDYRRCLKKLSNVINLGGYLIVVADINATFLNIGEDKFHILPCDENFYGKVIVEEGFQIKHYEKFDREMISDATDYKAVVFIVAHKVREP
ncbi:nicotinamide N-methyltransferase-like [Eleutherodactylus coqui]|uniref:nicotinamide N-methyltransferase-like n=1 Tax=Eleutherodactylus coqui TaxID=57060 RepID=UPI003462A1B1